MNGKTHKIRRRLSVIALAACAAAVAIPAAQARNTPVDDWFRDANATQPQNILIDDWFRDSNLNSQAVTTSVGSQDNEPSMCAVHLYPCGVLDNESNQDRASVTLPRADDAMFREIIQDAAQEHGVAGFGNYEGVNLALRPVHVIVVRDAGDATGAKLSLSWKPRTVDYTHLPSGDRP